MFRFAAIFVFALAPSVLLAAEPRPVIELRDGDRVVWLGGTFVERMQSYGYLETLLTAGKPEYHVTYRNLGWSGDTVFGHARAVFGSTADGFKRLIADLKQTQPTLVVICYGANEAQGGEAELPNFTAGLNRLLDEVGKTGARMALVSPPRRPQVSPRFPDPAAYNAKLKLYCSAIESTAAQRNLPYADLFTRLDNYPSDDGVTPSEAGYRDLAPRLASLFGVSDANWKIDLDVTQREPAAEHVAVTELNASVTAVRFQAIDRQLPYPRPAPSGVLRIRGLDAGHYTLSIDGQVVHTASQEKWAAGMNLPVRGGFAQAESLRRLIRDKDQLFFHRYRPQNETYLFLFRKHEQGNNAVEIPQFDPLIAEKEKQIAELRQPVKHAYELRRTETK